MSPTPEQQARHQIDAALEAAGWIIQDRAEMNLSAGPGGIRAERGPVADGTSERGGRRPVRRASRE